MSGGASIARRIGFETVRRTFEQGEFTERAFREAAEREGLAGRDRAQAQRLAFGSVQRRGTTDAAVELLAERSASMLDPPVLAALRLGLYELLFADGTPDHAAVSQAVELCKGSGAGHAAGLVNAVLRRAARERTALVGRLLGEDSTPEAAAVCHSAPLWLARMWWQELGAAAARSLLAACNEPAEVAMSVDTMKLDRDAVLGELEAEGVAVAAAGGGWPLAVPESLTLGGRGGAAIEERVRAGLLTPQSRGSAAVVEVLGPREGEHVLDLCAGPGIKTAQMAVRMRDRGELISVELDPGRAAEVAAQAERLGLGVVVVIEADATGVADPAGLAAGRGFDRVLLDAPCSDLGALASRPDARWRKSPRAIARLVEVQEQALLAAASALRPGGVLLYSTCTISRRENEERIAALLAASAAGAAPPLRVEDLGARAPALAAPGDRRCLQLRPDRDRTTGMFICRMRRDD